MLKCEACGHSLPSQTCADCDREVPIDAEYCCYCGKRLDIGPSAAKDDSPVVPTGDPFDLENRILCSDGSCIGVINRKGGLHGMRQALPAG